MTERHKIAQAATILLLRPLDEAKGFEVFLTRRPDGMAFLGGFYCFPGGALRKDDCSAAMLARCHGLSPTGARKILGAHLSPQVALGLWAAGIRELFEEVGILLAVNKSGQPWVAAGDHKKDFADKRAALLEKTLSFRSLLESKDLLCDASKLTYFSHWQTPGQFAIRFDTRFFLVVLPEGQVPLSTSPEVVHSVWITPDRALKLFAEDQLPMIFPTFTSLRTLADFESVESLLRAYGANCASQQDKAQLLGW
jgi:8-oxo-dGTP pyrophosphatase MutT (NUDIX family)